MKKTALLLTTGILTCCISYSMDVEVESGMSGFEIENNYSYYSLQHSLNKNTLSLYNKYLLLDKNNTNLFEKIKRSSNDKDNIISLGYSGLKLDSFKSNGLDLSYITNYNDMLIGVNYNYSDLKFDSKYGGSLNQLNLLCKIGDNEANSLLSMIYAGLISDDRSHSDDNVIGLKMLYESSHDTFDETNYTAYLKLDTFRYKNKIIGTTNDSIAVEPGVTYSKEINDNLKIVVSASYYHDFSNKNYKELNSAFDSTVNSTAGIEVKIGNVEITPRFEIRKSVKDSNYSTNIGVNFKINI